MSYTVEEERYGNVVVEVQVDDNPMSPRDADNLTIIRGWHRRYEIGDGPNIVPDDYEDWDDMIRSVVDEDGPLVLLAPLFWYEHSGVACKMGPNVLDGSSFKDSLRQFRVMCMDSGGWDSGVAGIVYVTKNTADKEWQVDPAFDVESCAREEVETYSDYISGRVYGYVVSIESECDHGDTHSDVLDSCWGLIGEPDYALEQGRDIVSWHVAAALTGGIRHGE